MQEILVLTLQPLKILTAKVKLAVDTILSLRRRAYLNLHKPVYMSQNSGLFYWFFFFC